MTAVSFVTSRLDLRIVKKTFLAMSVAVLLLIPVDVVRLHLKGQRLRLVPVSASNTQGPTQDSFESLASYETAFEKSVLFGVYNPKEALPVLKSSINELAKDYRLKGVILMAESEAIIEDARTQQSSFVKAGDSLGELRVEEIKEGAITLSYYGEKKALSIQ